MGSFAFLASLAVPTVGHAVEWPTLDIPAYVIDSANGTFGPNTASLRTQATEGNDFGAQMAEIYAMLSEGQVPLGEAFEAIWDANIDSLYEA